MERSYFLYQPMIIAFSAMLASTGMDVAAKLVSSNIGIWQMVTLRWAFSVFLLLVFRSNWSKLALMRIDARIHALRLVLNLIGSACLFYALSVLPLANVVSIFFAEPVIAMIFARLILGELVTIPKWCGAIIALFGIFYVTGIDKEQAYRYDNLIALAGAFSWGLMHVLTKKWGGKTDIVSLMFWLAAFTSCAAAPMAFLNWTPMNWQDALVLLGIACLGCIYGYLWIKGIRIAPVSLMVAMSYLSLPLAYLVGWLLFNEKARVDTMIGSIAILVGVMLATYHWRDKKATIQP